MPDKRLHHVGIVVDDMDEAVTFVTEVLDIPVDEIIDLGPGMGLVGWARVGEVAIELIQYDDPEMRDKHLGDKAAVIEHICFDTGDADADYARLAKNGVKFRRPVDTRSDHKTFFTDPESSDGVIYQFREQL